jgi:hypothetical protein
MSAGSLLTAVGAPVRGAFDAKERAVTLCRRILFVAEEGSLKPGDAEVVRWIASSQRDLESAYAVCDPTVMAKVCAVLENVNEASSLDAYVSQINYPEDMLIGRAREQYGKNLEEQLEIDPNALPTEAESRELAEKAKALRLTEMDVQDIHEYQFGSIFGEACKDAVSAETDELMSNLDALRVRLAFSERKAQSLLEAAIATELKPAADEIMLGYKKASGETIDEDKKPIGFQGGVTAAVDKILDVSKKSFADFTLVSMGLVHNNDALPLYKYVMSQDMTRAAAFAPVLGITEAEQEQAHGEVAARVLGKQVYEALKDDKPVTAELTSGLWEPLGLPQEWAEKYISTQKSLFITGKFEDLYVKGVEMDALIQIRSLADEMGVKLNDDGFSLYKRMRFFRAEVRDKLEKQMDLEAEAEKEALEEVIEFYGLTDAEADAEVEAALKDKEECDRILAMIGQQSCDLRFDARIFPEEQSEVDRVTSKSLGRNMRRKYGCDAAKRGELVKERDRQMKHI